LFAQLGRDDVVDAHLDLALAGSVLHGPSLLYGLAGVAFTLAQLGGEVSDGVDDGLAEALAPDLHHDLLAGVSGIGVYACERMPATAALLGRVIDWLNEHTTRASPGRYLFSAPDRIGPSVRARFPNGTIDLGVAHGQGAAISLAGAATAWGVPGARALYEDLVAYQWSQASDRAPFFKTMVGAPATGRGWCYGDVGLATALFAAAAAVGDDDSKTRALELGRAAAARVVLADVPDVHLCHGVVGIAHIFNRLAQAARDDELAAAARACYERALAMPLPAALDVLQGQLGIALTLCAAIEHEEPAWDRAFAMSVRRPDQRVDM
jgi:hypothetical protein